MVFGLVFPPDIHVTIVLYAQLVIYRREPIELLRNNSAKKKTLSASENELDGYFPFNYSSFT